MVGKFGLPLLGAALCAATGAAGAGESSASMMVTVNIVASCTLDVDAAALSFGDVAQDARGADAQTEVGMRCSSGQPYAIGFDDGRHAQGAQRQVSNGSAGIRYGLYADAAHRRQLGPRGTADELRGVGNGERQSLPVYARLDLDKDVPPGAYGDVVRMTVTW